jgi:hypothetical protein
MNDDTRKLLKVFGRHRRRGQGRTAGGHRWPAIGGVGKEEVARLLKDSSDLCRELNTRWLEITQRVFAIQSRLQQQLAEAAVKWSGTSSP